MREREEARMRKAKKQRGGEAKLEGGGAGRGWV